MSLANTQIKITQSSQHAFLRMRTSIMIIDSKENSQKLTLFEDFDLSA